MELARGSTVFELIIRSYEQSRRSPEVAKTESLESSAGLLVSTKNSFVEDVQVRHNVFPEDEEEAALTEDDVDMTNSTDGKTSISAMDIVAASPSKRSYEDMEASNRIIANEDVKVDESVSQRRKLEENMLLNGKHHDKTADDFLFKLPPIPRQSEDDDDYFDRLAKG